MKRYRNPLARGKYRNDPCVCGSGKKVKNCHGKESSVSLTELENIMNMIDNFRMRYKKALDDNIKEEIERLSKGDLSGNKEESTNT